MRIEHPDPRRLQELRQLWKQVFGDTDDFLDSFYRTAFSPDRCRCVLENDCIVSVLYWIDCTLDNRKLAYLYAVATHPSYRGRGFCRRLLEDTHALLHRQGYAGVLLVPQDLGLRGMYSKMGYQNIGGIRQFACDAADYSVPLRVIGPSEFAARRRQLLPAGGVLQEGTGLVFLAEQLQFYTGTDFLLAGYCDASVFHGAELLGNIAAAPGILRALGCDRGTFCTSGTEDPFSMFLPLTEDAKQPGYFAFAFD